jgi:thiamine-phosphate pyrophosphorylase
VPSNRGLLLYYITDRTQFAGDERARQRALLAKIVEATRWGVDFIQLREKDLSAGELESLARNAVEVVREQAPQAAGLGRQTRILINSRVDVAIACMADGVQLRSDDISPRHARNVWRQSFLGGDDSQPIIGVSCHTQPEVAEARFEGADFAVFAPVFEKRETPGTIPTGLEALREACRENIQVFALGGITVENAGSCREAGAAGIAGIRLFQQADVGSVVAKLRPTP